jgi:phytoene synthase
MHAVYAFARRVDDIADGEPDRDGQLSALAEARRAALDPIAYPADPVLLALADAHERFALPLEAFADLVDGAEMDVVGTTYETFGELTLYCRRVGGTIGRLAAAVFGARDPKRAAGLADDLGVAFQLTNILRDVSEDLDQGRVYLPREDLLRFEVDLASPSPRFAELVRFEAVRADGWYERGLELVPLLDRASAASVSAMAGIYRRLLRRIEREPDRVLGERLSLPTWEKGWVAARSLVGAAT